MNTITTNLLKALMRAIRYGKLVKVLNLDSETLLNALIGTLTDSDVPVSQIPGSGNLLSQIQARLSRVESSNLVSNHLLIRIGQIVERHTPDLSFFDLMETSFYLGKLQAETEASDTYTKLESLMYGKISESFTGFSADGHKPQPEEVRNQFDTVVQFGKVVRRLRIDIGIPLSSLRERLPAFPIKWRPGTESYYREMKEIGVTGGREHYFFRQLGQIVNDNPQPSYINLMEIAFFIGHVEAEIWTPAASHIYTREIKRLYDGWELAYVNSYVDINL